jgi:hypothetical protein
MDINILEHIVNMEFDVKPFIKDSIIKQVKSTRLPENCTHFYDYIDRIFLYV